MHFHYFILQSVHFSVICYRHKFQFSKCMLYAEIPAFQRFGFTLINVIVNLLCFCNIPFWFFISFWPEAIKLFKFLNLRPKIINICKLTIISSVFPFFTWTPNEFDHFFHYSIIIQQRGDNIKVTKFDINV